MNYKYDKKVIIQTNGEYPDVDGMRGRLTGLLKVSSITPDTPYWYIVTLDQSYVTPYADERVGSLVVSPNHLVDNSKELDFEAYER